MKNKFLLIMVAIIIISGVVGLFSFVIIDRQNLNFANIRDEFTNGGFIFNMNHNKRYNHMTNSSKSWNIDDITEIDIKKLTGDIVFKESDSNRIEYYGNFLDGEKDIEIIDNNGKLEIRQLRHLRDFHLVIYLQNWKKVSVNVDNLLGKLDITERIKDLSINNFTGALKIEGDRSFDINIDNFVGEIDMEFEELDATIDFENILGELNVKGNESVKGTNKSFNRTFGEGKNEISIESLIGRINIDD